MVSNLIENRQIRIFISSTFTDMEAERNLLIKYVFPQLRVEASKRNVSLMMVDLRWGITEEEYKRGKILEICLSEIENSHPFFIGILGDRYGWQPDISQIQKNVNLKERYPWITDDLAAGLSVTEIEMQFGVLRKQAETNSCFFIKQASDSNVYAESTDAQNKLRRLKEEVMSNGRYPYFLYSDIAEIGQQVKTDFMALLDKYFPEKKLSAIEIKRTAQHSVLNALCSSYIPVEENFTALNQFLDSEQKQFCVTGASGLGKSALMANWIKQLEETNDYTVIYHFVGTSDTGTYYENVLKRFSDEISNRFSISISDEDYKKKPEDLLNNVIFRIPSNQKVILIIDAVNQINKNNHAKQLAWLPALPQHVKLVLSTLPDDDTFAAINRRKFAVHTIKPLERQDRVRMVTEYLKCYGKTLTRKQLLRIITNKVAENTLVLKTLLNQLILFGRYEELDERIDYYLAAQSISEFFQKVLQRAEEDYGKDLTRHALSLIGLSRNGMSESELTDIMQCTPLEWSQVYCAFVSHFTIKNGLINFAHTYLKEAVSERYLREQEANNKLRTEIMSYFEGNEEYRALDELPYQYYLMKDNERLYKFLMNLQHFDYLYKKDRHKLCKYWQRLRYDTKHSYTVTEYLPLIEKLRDDNQRKVSSYHKLSRFAKTYVVDLNLSLFCLRKALHILNQKYGKKNLHTESIYRDLSSLYIELGHYEQALHYSKIALKIRIHESGEININTVRNYNCVAKVYLYRKQYNKALNYYEKALQIQYQVLDKIDDTFVKSINDIGSICELIGKHEKALSFFKKSLKIQLLLYGFKNRNTASIYNNIGTSYKSLGQYETALRYKNRALRICLSLFGSMNPQVASICSSIGKVNKLMGNYEKASIQQEKALEIETQIYTNDYKAICDLADIKLDVGKYIEAITLCFNSVDKCTSNLRSNFYLTCGSSLFFLERYDEALAMHLKTWEERKKLYGAGSDLAMNACDWVGRDYLMLNKLDKAISILTTVYLFYKDTDPETALFSYKYLAIAYGKSGEKDKAIKMLEEGLQQLDDCTVDRYANKGNYLYDYASYLYEEGAFVKALHLAEEGLKLMKLYYQELEHPHKIRLVKLIEDIRHTIA